MTLPTKSLRGTDRIYICDTQGENRKMKPIFSNFYNGTFFS